MISQAEMKIWPKENPSAIAENRVSFMSHDFFTPNPVKGADIYYLRSVLLDWGDDDVVTILENLRVSMVADQSRLIIS